MMNLYDTEFRTKNVFKEKKIYKKVCFDIETILKIVWLYLHMNATFRDVKFRGTFVKAQRAKRAPSTKTLLYI